MSTLTSIEKLYLEKLLDMSGGYVMNFTDRTFGEFFDQHNINIHERKYQTQGTSKANKLRTFWALESDQVVRTVMSDMLDNYEASCNLHNRELDRDLLEKVRKIVGRLTGSPIVHRSMAAEDKFLAHNFSIPNIQKMQVDAQVVPIVEARLKEAEIALAAGAHLSVIFLCGSVLEAMLLGTALQDPKSFNQTKATPKTAEDKPRYFHEWNLAQLIDVACEVGVLKPDIKKFGHGLRDFRNYIHPYEQVKSDFTPDRHTATLCFQVLKAALASLAGERP